MTTNHTRNATKGLLIGIKPTLEDILAFTTIRAWNGGNILLGHNLEIVFRNGKKSLYSPQYSLRKTIQAHTPLNTQRR
jgi:hypothetical protein